jgi:hypothetical protein
MLGLSNSVANIGSLTMIAATCAMTIVSLNFVDNFGRRPTLIVCGSLTQVSLVVYIIFAELVDRIRWAKYACLCAILFFNLAFRYGNLSLPKLGRGASIVIMLILTSL